MVLRYFLVFVSLALIGASIACGGNADNIGVAATSPNTDEVEVIEISIGGPGPSRFRPSLIEIQRGTTATLQITGTNNLNHSFTVSRLNIDLRLSPGETVETEPLTFNEAANIFFICRFHTASGAAGTIRVSD